MRKKNKPAAGDPWAEGLPFLTVSETARVLRRSVPTVYRLAGEGHLTVRKSGARTLFARAEIEKYLATMPSGLATSPNPRAAAE